MLDRASATPTRASHLALAGVLYLLHTVPMKKTNFNNYFLIAMPNINAEDTTFSKSVIFICEHGDDGAMGIIINKPLNVTLGSVLEHLDIEADRKVSNTPVFMGGPVGQEHGFVIHEPYRADENHDDLVISASKETLSDIARRHGPDRYLVALGYTGWSAGQLEEEIGRNDWLVVPYDKEIIFRTPVERRWSKAVELLGVDINKLSSHVGHA